MTSFQEESLALDLPTLTVNLHTIWLLFHYFIMKIQTIANLALGAGVVTDISTAVALCYYLQKLRTGHAK